MNRLAPTSPNVPPVITMVLNIEDSLVRASGFVRLGFPGPKGRGMAAAPGDSAEADLALNPIYIRTEISLFAGFV
jgi:hypothetical protein